MLGKTMPASKIGIVDGMDHAEWAVWISTSLLLLQLLNMIF